MLEKPKKIYFTHIKGPNIRNIFPVFEHDLAEWRSASGYRHKLRHSNSGREKFGSANTAAKRTAHEYKFELPVNYAFPVTY